MSALESPAITRKNTTCATHCRGGPSAGQSVKKMVARVQVARPVVAAAAPKAAPVAPLAAPVAVPVAAVAQGR